MGCDSMSITDTIIILATTKNGTISHKDIVHAGIHSEYLRTLVKSGELERISRGQYVLKNYLSDELDALQKQFSRGIFSYDTALYLFGLTDRTPMKYSMTFPRKYNISSVARKGVQAYRVDEKYYELGVVRGHTQYGNDVWVYSLERTLCDLLRPNCKVSVEIITEAYKQYSVLKQRDLLKLMEYSKIFKVEHKVRNYLEVLM